MSDYVPVSWNGESVSTDKLNQMANNDQYLFDRSPKIRYSSSNLTRDTSLKVIAGKTPFQPHGKFDWTNVVVYFGSFFTAGCHPSVTAVAEVTGGWMRKFVAIKGLAGEIDHTGFLAQVVSQESIPGNGWIEAGGWVHWQAVGY